MEWIIVGAVLALLLFFVCAVCSGIKDWRRTRRKNIGKHSVDNTSQPLDDGDLPIINWWGVTRFEWEELRDFERAEIRRRFFNSHGL